VQLIVTFGLMFVIKLTSAPETSLPPHGMNQAALPL
jgi:hypothetical protein